MLKIDFPGFNSHYSLHNHSDWSDGQDTLEAMCRGAKDAGIPLFGMSDHWVAAPKPGMNSETWSMKLERLPEYIKTLKQLRSELEDESFKLLIGVEADYFHENHTEVFEKLNSIGLDYLIGSVHYSDIFPIDHDASDWQGLSQAKIDEIWTIYWEKLIAAAEFGQFDILGHLDLPKKFAYLPSFDYTPMALKVLDAAQKTDKAIELNTAGWDKPCQEQYPSNLLLKEAFQRHIPVVISADAHAVSQLTRHFEKAEKLCKIQSETNWSRS